MSRRAFTLLEILVVVGLVSLLTSMLLMLVTRIARITRQTSTAALRRRHWLEAAERLRWQLRNLHVPSTRNPPKDTARTGLVGNHETALWGEPGSQEGLDWLTFLTTVPTKQRGVCEVSFCLKPASAGDAHYTLMWRQFPLRERFGLHSLSDYTEAPWKPLLDDVTQLSLDYTEDGWVWRRDWSIAGAPRRVRVHLEAVNLPVLDFQVTPGIGAGRW